MNISGWYTHGMLVVLLAFFQRPLHDSMLFTWRALFWNTSNITEGTLQQSTSEITNVQYTVRHKKKQNNWLSKPAYLKDVIVILFIRNFLCKLGSLYIVHYLQNWCNKCRATSQLSAETASRERDVCIHILLIMLVIHQMIIKLCRKMCSNVAKHTFYGLKSRFRCMDHCYFSVFSILS